MSLSHSYNNEMLNTRDHNNNNNNTSECMSLSTIHNHSLIQQQDFPLQWPHDQSSYHHHEGLLKIKEELSSSTISDHHQEGISKFTDMLNSPVITNYLKINEHKDYTEKLLLKTISSAFPINNGDYCSNLPSSSSSSSPSSQSHRGNFSQIYPSVNISSLSESRKMDMSNIPRPFDMNMQVLDGRLFEGNVLVPPLNSQDLGMSRGSFPSFGIPFHHHLQQTLQHPSSSPTHQVSIF